MAGNILDTDAMAAQMSAQDAQYAKQASAAAAQRQAQEQQAKQPPTLTSVGMQDHGHVTPGIIDHLLSWIDSSAPAEMNPVRGARDIGAGLVTGAANVADAANPAHVVNEAGEQLAKTTGSDGKLPISFELPIWDHAKSSILDFRDALAVKDPGVTDSLLQAGAQLVPSFMAYSKALSNVHGISNTILAGGLTDLTALQPHDMRTADLIALGRQTDTKIGHALQALGPYGLNAYVNYLADRSNETEAEGRFKNALDGFGANLILTPLLHAAGIVVKQGMAGARFMAENGVGSASELAPNLAAQRGAVGDLSQPRPALRQNYDPAEALLEEQVRRDADIAHANPNGSRPPLVQGADPAAQMFDAQARADAEAAAKKMGTIVYHGTPYDFDHFDLSKIGTGEGNQTFGHGLYFAEKPETAGHYQQMLVQRTGAVGAAIADAQAAVKAAGGRAQAYAQLSQQFAREKDPLVRQQLQQQMQLIRSGNYARGSGNLMHVEIPNEHIDNMFHWDQPINEQPKVQKVIDNLKVRVVPEGGKYRVMVGDKPGPLYPDRSAALSDTDILRGEGATGKVNAGMFYDQLANALRSQKAASEFLGRRGVTGIKFLDQGSRDAGEGTHNIVLFNDKHATIVKKERAGA